MAVRDLNEDTAGSNQHPGVLLGTQNRKYGNERCSMGPAHFFLFVCFEKGFQVWCPGYPQTHFVAEDDFELLSALPRPCLLSAGITGVRCQDQQRSRLRS